MSIEESSGIKIGNYVKYQRSKRELSLQEFSNLSSLTPSYISRLENGDYRSISFAVIEKLAKGFSIPVMDFLHKCEVIEEKRIYLPNLEFYLRETYQLPDEAVEDVKIFLEFIKEKYKNEITSLKKKHNKYWER